MSKPAETFVAFKKGPAREGPSELEMAVNYDVASEVDDRNGWVEPGCLPEDTQEKMVQVAARGLNELFLFCFNGQVLSPDGRGLQTAIRRFVSVAWMIHSNELRDGDDEPLSLEKLSKLPQVDCTRCTLSLLAQEFGRRWGFRVRVQKKETTKKNYAKAAKHGWKKRRLREKRDEQIT